MHEFSEQTKRLLDIIAAACAGVAAITINDVAAFVTVLAGIVSIACGAVRLYDRFSLDRSPS